MSISSKDVKAAVGLLDLKDAAQWAAPGVPTIAAMETLVPGITVEDLRKAGFAAVEPKETGGEPATTASASPQADPPLPEVPAVLPPVHATTVDMARAIIAKSQKELREVQNEIDTAINLRSQITAQIELLVGDKDRHLHIIEDYSPRISFAESVKKIQLQTIEQNKARLEKQRALRDAQLSNGTVFPTALDASMAARRKTPEQAANLAKFIAQQAARQIAERG